MFIVFRAKHRQTVHAHAKSKHKGCNVQDVLETPGPESIKRTKRMVAENGKLSSVDTQLPDNVDNEDVAQNDMSLIVQNDQTMYERYTEEVIVKSEQDGAGPSSTFVAVDELQSVSALANNIILHNGSNKEINVLGFDACDGKTFTVQTTDDQSLSLVQEENGELTFKTLNLGQETMQVVDQSVVDVDTALNNECVASFNQKQIEVVLLSMPTSTS